MYYLSCFVYNNMKHNEIKLILLGQTLWKWRRSDQLCSSLSWPHYPSWFLGPNQAGKQGYTCSETYHTENRVYLIVTSAAVESVSPKMYKMMYMLNSGDMFFLGSKYLESRNYAYLY